MHWENELRRSRSTFERLLDIADYFLSRRRPDQAAAAAAIPAHHASYSHPGAFTSARLEHLLARLGRFAPVNVLVAGKQGCGKSTMVRQFAARNQRPLATFQIGMLSEPGQLFGEHSLKDGETYYRRFLFPDAIQTPGCVIRLEEINLLEHPKALNMLFSILSEDRRLYTDELGHIQVADGVVFFATLNEGDEFIGTEMLDAALRDRFYVALLGLPAAGCGNQGAVPENRYL